MPMPTLDEILGHDLARQLTATARLQVENHARGNVTGVRRVAREILRDTTIRNPAAVLLSRLDRGQHKTPDRTHRSRRAAPPAPPPVPLTAEQIERNRRWAVVMRLARHHGIVARILAVTEAAELAGTDQLDAAEHELARKDTAT